VGISGAGFFARFGAVVRLVVVVVLRLVVLRLVVLRPLLLRRGRPGMGLPLVPRHGMRRHRRNV
jgi:hypothetical protein